MAPAISETMCWSASNTMELVGYGESAAVPYYGDTQESLTAYLNALPPLNGSPFALESILNRLPDGSHAAQAGVDIALHDSVGKAGRSAALPHVRT